MRAGAVDYMVKPVAADVLARRGRAAAPTGWAAPAWSGRGTPGVTYAFASAKGGSGSTTVVTNLAISLHQLTGKKTLLVDLELELGEVALFLGVQPRFNFVDMVQNFHRMDAGLLASFIERHPSGVHLLSAPYHPDRAEAVSADQIRRIMNFLRQHYDYVLVDTSKSLSPATLAVFEQSDLVFVVTSADLPSIRNIQRGLPLIRRALVGGEQQIRVIVNRYHGGEAISLKDIERTLGLKVYSHAEQRLRGGHHLGEQRQAADPERQLEVRQGSPRAGVADLRAPPAEEPPAAGQPVPPALAEGPPHQRKGGPRR